MADEPDQPGGQHVDVLIHEVGIDLAAQGMGNGHELLRISQGGDGSEGSGLAQQGDEPAGVDGSAGGVHDARAVLVKEAQASEVALGGGGADDPASDLDEAVERAVAGGGAGLALGSGRGDARGGG